MSFNPLKFLKSLPEKVIDFIRGFIEAFRAKNEKQFTVVISILMGLVALIYQLLYGALSESIALNATVTNILEQVLIWLGVIGFLLNTELPEIPETDDNDELDLEVLIEKEPKKIQ